MKIIRYNRGKEQEEIEKFLKENPDYALVGIRNTIDGDFLIFRKKDEIEAERVKEEMQKLREQVIEKILEDEDITEIKKKYKELKSKLLSLESKFKEDFVNKRQNEMIL